MTSRRNIHLATQEIQRLERLVSAREAKVERSTDKVKNVSGKNPEAVLRVHLGEVSRARLLLSLARDRLAELS